MWDMREWDVAELTASILPPLLTAKHYHTITTITAITPSPSSQPSHYRSHHHHHTTTITPSPPSHHHQPPSSMEEVCGGYSVLLSGWDTTSVCPDQVVSTTPPGAIRNTHPWSLWKKGWKVQHQTESRWCSHFRSYCGESCCWFSQQICGRRWWTFSPEQLADFVIIKAAAAAAHTTTNSFLFNKLAEAISPPLPFSSLCSWMCKITQKIINGNHFF